MHVHTRCNAAVSHHVLRLHFKSCIYQKGGGERKDMVQQPHQRLPQCRFRPPCAHQHGEVVIYRKGKAGGGGWGEGERTWKGSTKED